MKPVPAHIREWIVGHLMSDQDGGIPGWCTPFKGEWLAAHILDEKLTYIVEIGVFGGRSLIPMGLALKHLGRGGYAIGLDPYETGPQIENQDNPAHVKWAQDIPWEAVYQGTLRAIRELDLGSHCGILRCTAEAFAPFCPALDLVHLDGCHTVLASCRDVEAWAPKVRPGGLIVLDDCEWESVQPAREMLRAVCEPPRVYEAGWEVWRKV